MPIRPGALLAVAALASTTVARADDAPPEPPARKLTWHAGAESATPPSDAPAPRQFQQERPFVHLMDPTTPAAGQVGVEYEVGAASGGANRSLPTSVVAPGVAHGFGASVGATDRVAPFFLMRSLQAPGEASTGPWSGVAGVRWAVVPATAAGFRLTLAGAAMRDFAAGAGVFARAAASWDLGRVRLAANVHGERVFQSARDGVDVLVMGGVSYRTLDVLRVGVEWVGQDVEESLASGAEGGARHYAGPTLALDLWQGRAQLVGGPAFGLTQQTPGLLGKLALVASF